MSNSPLGSGGVPPDPVPNPIAAAQDKFASALYRANDALRRAGDGIEVGPVANCNTAYALKQLDYAKRCIEQAMTAAETIGHEVNAMLAAHANTNGKYAQGKLPLTGQDGPYEGGL